MALAFAILVAVITLLSVGAFAGHLWWLPPAVAGHGPAIDRQFQETFLGTGLLFVLAQLLLAYVVWKYRERGDNRKISFFPGGTRLTVSFAVTVMAVELFVLGAVSQRVWASIYLEKAPPAAMRIQVQAEQFAFYFRYPGADGKFGLIHPDLIDASAGNFFGLDRQHDAESRDDVMTATLGIPADRPVELILRSKDVIHSFYVPELRLQQDMVPGMEIPIHFTATKTGRYEIVCTQLCGLGHYRMRAFLQVMPEADFNKWVQGQAAYQ